MARHLTYLASPVPKRQGGFVLLMVLMVTALLFAIMQPAMERQWFQIHKIRNENNLQTAYLNAHTALGQVMELLLMDAGSTETDHLLEVWAQVPPLQMEDGQVAVVVQDLSRYWNLNHLVNVQGKVNQGLHNVLLALFQREELGEEALDALIDWLDPDELPSGLGGAERAFYMADGFPYGSKNRPLKTLHEALSIRGWDADLVAGLNGLAVAGEGCRTGLNVNTAGREVLSSVDPGWSGADLDAIISAREEKPFQAVTELAALPQLSGKSLPSQLLSVRSDCFRVTIRSSVGEVTGVMQAQLQRQQGRVSVGHLQWNG